MQLSCGHTRYDCGHWRARSTVCSLYKPGARQLNRQGAARQVVAALANSSQQKPATDAYGPNGTSSTSNDDSNAGTIMLSAASLLERSAAASRPAGPPEHMEASTSARSSIASAHRRSRASRPSSSSSSCSCSTGHDVPYSSWDVVQHIAESAVAAQASGAAEVNALMSALVEDDGVTPKFQTSSSDSSALASSHGSSSSNGENPQQGLTDSGYQLMLVITQQILTWQDLAKLVETRAGQFTAKHCAAALHRLTAMWQQQWRLAAQQQQQAMRAELRLQQPAVLQLATVLLKGTAQQMDGATGRDLADALCAAAKLGLALPPASSAEAAAEAVTAPNSVGRGSRQVASSTRQKQQPAAASEQLQGFTDALLQRSRVLMCAGALKALPLSRVLWGLASTGLDPGLDWWAAALDATAGHLQDTQLQYQQQQQQQHHCSEAGPSPLHEQQEGQDECQPGQQQDQQRQQHPQYSYNAESIARVGWAVAKLGRPAPAAWWQCYQEAARQLLQEMDAQQLSCCMWALATAQQVPNASWMQGFYAASGAKLSQFTPQGLSLVLWALAVLQQQPPRHWCEQYDTASTAQLHRFSMQHLSRTLWAAGRLSTAAKAAAVTAARSSTRKSRTGTNSSSSSTSSKSLQEQEQQQQREVEGLGSSHLGQAFPSSAWFDQAWVQLSSVQSEATPQGLSCILWGLVQLNMAVPEQRMVQLERLAADIWQEAEPQGLAILVWALGVLRGPAADRHIIKRLPRHCMHNPELLTQQLSAQGLLMLLHGLAKVKAFQPGAFKQQLLAAVQARMDYGLRLLPSQHQQAQQGVDMSVPLSSRRSSSSSSSSTSTSTSSRQAWTPHELPSVLLSLTQLKVALPTPLLQQCESLLLPYVSNLSIPELAVCLFALGSARHNPTAAFVTSAMSHLCAHVEQCGPQDVAHVLHGLAAMGGCGSMLVEQQQQQQIERLLGRTQQVIPEMDHSCLAMTMWAIARLSLRPSEDLLLTCLTATTAALPRMTLISITSILTAMQSLHYLPPLPWMVETCNAARTIYHTDKTCKAWQRRASLRRLEETVAWFNAMVQQQAEAAGGASSVSGAPGQEGKVQGQQGQSRSVLAGSASSEAMIAAAVGVAAAVAQQWRW